MSEDVSTFVVITCLDDKADKKQDSKPAVALKLILKHNKELANLNSIPSDSEDRPRPTDRVNQSLDDSEHKLNDDSSNARNKANKNSSSENSKDDNSQSLVEILNGVKPNNKAGEKIEIKLNSSAYDSEEEDDIDNERQLKYLIKSRFRK